MQAAQIVHAAGESSPGDLPEGTYAVVLSVPDEGALKALKARLTLARVEFVAIYEPDRGNELMALGVKPRRKEELKRHLSSLPLLR